MNPNLKAILEGANAATEGPLIITRHDNEGGWISYQLETESHSEDDQIVAWFSELSNFKKARKNAEFFKSARTDVPLLCNLLDEALKALENLLFVKNYKDKNGKDEHYNSAQPLAWEQADQAIKSINEKLEK